MFRRIGSNDNIPIGTECIIIRYTNPYSTFLGEETLRGFCSNSNNNRIVLENCIKYENTRDAVNQQNGEDMNDDCRVMREDISEIYIIPYNIDALGNQMAGLNIRQTGGKKRKRSCKKRRRKTKKTKRRVYY